MKSQQLLLHLKVLPLFLLVVFIFGLAGCFSAQTPEENAAVPTGKLTISPDGRRILQEDGTPFIWLGDTAWELFHRLNREEVDLYLNDRAGKGFNVIQAVVLAELEGLTVPNPYGQVPLIDNDPAQPDESYFEHVDYTVNKAADLGMYIGMLPTWGDKFNKKWGVGPEVFTPENARIYGAFLGSRYKDKPIIWILGGDRNPDDEEDLAITRALAEGIREGSGGTQLMTYHPQGGSKSFQWFHNDEWLDLNLFQSGHSAYNIPNYQFTEEGYLLQPVKPVIDGEPRYEDHPVNWRPENGWFDEFDVRQAAYWSMLSGAAGHTYGNHNIWQMWQPDRNPISSARTPWKEAIGHIGSTQVGYMRDLFESRPFLSLIPDQSIFAAEPDTGAAHMRAARDAEGRYLFAYTPYGKPVSIDLSKMGGNQLKAWWFDPRTGEAQEIGSFQQGENQTFDPPGEEGRGNDWVLVVDDADVGFNIPGEVD